MKTKNTQKLIVALCSTILLTSCDELSGENSTTPQTTKQCFIVIKDQSASVQDNASDIEKQKLWVKRYLHDNFVPESDLLLLYVNSASNSSMSHSLFEWKYTENTSEDEYQSETDKMLAENSKMLSDRSQAQKIQKSLLEKLFDPNVQRSNQTLIIELMPELERLTKKFESVKILFLSDLIQESSIRTFSSLPTSKQQAEHWATIDSKTIKTSFSLNGKVLSKVRSIEVLVPPGTEPQKLVYPPYYFQQFFADFGYNNEIIWSSL